LADSLWAVIYGVAIYQVSSNKQYLPVKTGDFMRDILLKIGQFSSEPLFG